MKDALIAKYTQNSNLGKFLKDTGESLLVEANPNDSYWGAELSLSNPDIWIQEKWLGKNTLGSILQQVRETL